MDNETLKKDTFGALRGRYKQIVFFCDMTFILL